MTTSGVEIVPYNSELEDQVVALWADSFGIEFARRHAYLKWKYERNPYLPDPLVFVALDATGRVVGTRGFCGTCWHTPEGNIVIPCAEDFAIVPDHRNTGLATALMRTALEDLEQRGFEYVMNGSGGQITVLHSLAMGWKSIGAMHPVGRLARRERARLSIYQFHQRPRRLWRPRLSRIVYRTLYGRGGTSFEHLDRVGLEPSAEPRATIVIESSPSSDALADTAARLPSDGRIRHVRDPAFFEWRYGNPTREYRFLRYELDGQTEGYMTIARYRSSLPPTLPFHISDWQGTTHEIRAELLESAVAWGGFRALGTWTASLSEESKALLAESGFGPDKSEGSARGVPCVLLKKLGPGEWSVGGVPAIDPSHWDIRLIDSMHG